MIEIFHLLKVGKMEWTHWELCPYRRMFGQKALKMYFSSLCIKVYNISEETKVLILSLVFTIIFSFLRTLLITLILDERYMCCSIKIQNNSPHKYIAYSLASYYLNLIGSGIYWIKSRDSIVDVVSVFNFSVIFCYHVKSLFIISNLLKIYKVIVSNLHQNLDDKLVKECVRVKINIL